MRNANEASNAMHRRKRWRNANESKRRAARGRIALEAAELVPGRDTTCRHSQILVVDHPALAPFFNRIPVHLSCMKACSPRM